MVGDRLGKERHQGFRLGWTELVRILQEAPERL